MTLGVIGEKLGMTQIFDKDGLVVPVTVIKAESLTVTQIKTIDNDGYNAIQVGVMPCKKKCLTNPELKHLEKNNLPAFRHLQEFRVDNVNDYSIGQKVDITILKEGEKVDVTGKSIGKGFQGTVKRFNACRGPMAHGSKFHRSMGSIGAGTTPARVYKGSMMPGNMGNAIVTVKKLTVVKVDKEKNLILIKGSVPGTEGKLVTINSSITKWNK
ncbi:MAG: 50S ribosomal protein L3 [bacterium]